MRPTGEWLSLAEAMRRMRKAAGLTGDRLAAQLGWPRSKVPKIENGRQLPSEADIAAWAEACGQPDAVPGLSELLAGAQTAHRQWRHRLRAGHAAIQEEYGDLVRGGKDIAGYEPVVVPGLLQTPAYARCRIAEVVRVHGTAAGGVDATVEARMRRQESLYDAGKTFQFVITEAALWFLLCPPEVMAGQLDRLLTASVLGNLTLGVIPFGTELAVAPPAGFLVVDDVVITETATGYDRSAGQEAADSKRIFGLLMGEAVTGEQARKLITAAAAGLEGGRRTNTEGAD